jgi:RimJ/RimL family protein N-acetyltransferase/GNAT superfamily N-acetyltransferase
MRFEAVTPRLVLRRPTMADLPFHIEVHSDPRLYGHAPHVMTTDPAQHEQDLRAWLRQWDETGYGYWLVEDRETGLPLGFAGVRAAEGFHNLYYRFSAAAHGRGLARAAAREAVAMATEWLPGQPVQALVKAHNTASVRTAQAAGLVETGSRRLGDDRPDEAPSLVFEAPRVTRADRFDEAAREDVLDLWCRVNDSGGSVGFLPGAARPAVAAALARHEEQMLLGTACAGELREPDGTLVGLAWLVRGDNPLQAHGLGVMRLMVDPDRQGRNLGRILLGGLHRLAREVPGVEQVTLDYRSGSGLGEFYARCGYDEVGRIPRAIRVGPGDDRDSVVMARRLDGMPLKPDGRT